MAYKTRVKFFAKLLIKFYANADIAGQEKTFTSVLFECKNTPKPLSAHTEMTQPYPPTHHDAQGGTRLFDQSSASKVNAFEQNDRKCPAACLSLRADADLYNCNLKTPADPAA